MSEHLDSTRARADIASGSARSTLLAAWRRLLPVNPSRRLMAIWAVLHGVAAVLAGALLWRVLPQHLLIPWLMFMLLTGGLCLMRGLSRPAPGVDESDGGTLQCFVALTFGAAWAIGLVVASAFMNTQQQLLAILSLAPLAAVTLPLLQPSMLASRAYAVLLTIPGVVILAVTPDAGLFAAAYAVATATVTTLWVMSSATDPASRSQALLHPYRGLQRIVSDAHADGTRGLLQTLAQQKQTLFTAQQERDRARATLQSLNEAVVTTDTHGRIDYVNPAAEVLTGWSAGMAMGQEAVRVIAMVSGGKPGDTVSPIEQSLLTERTVIGEHDTTLIRRDGSHCEIDYTCAPVRDAAGRFSGLVLSMRDVSETRDMQARLSWAATHDGLTGLINRREFEARLGKLHTAAVADGTSHALCFIDLDHFKTLNDTCGHLAGDDFLKGLAETLRGRIRGADTLARLGGDEFAVLLYSCPLEVAARIAENLRRAVADYCAGWRDHTPLLGASIGVVTITDACKSLNDILATADLACYAAKSEGRNRVNVFRGNAEMLERWQGEVRWLQIIQTALEENRFVLHWQPIRTLADGTQHTMCELFVHLRDADSTLHAPADFLPTAQRYHLMPAIDFWVVSVVANALRTWHAVLSPMNFIGINLSTQSVTDERFEVELMDVLSDPAIPAYKLCFQISEAAFMSHPARVRHLTARLKARGCRLAVDECGVGVGSFNHLRSQEVDYLKIHDEFTRELAVSAIDREVVLALHRIVHCMGGRTIAERVADEAVLKQLAELGVDYAQGFAVARPEPLEVGATPAVSATQVA